MDDTIYRQAAIRWVKTECNPYGNPTLDFESGKKVIEHLKQMPSAQPKKKGKWIHGQEVCREYVGETLMLVKFRHWECSVCGYRTENEPIWKFCPNCGARMVDDDIS